MNWLNRQFDLIGRKTSLSAALILLLMLSFAFLFEDKTSAAAGINQQLTYQGKMTSAAGTQVADSSWNFRFRIYDAATNGNLLWTERWTATTTQVTTVNGVFSVTLGSLGQADSLGNIDWNSDTLYLQVDLDADSNGSFEENFATRKRITSAGYAFNADLIDGLHATSTAAVANYLVSLDTNGILNLYDSGVSSTAATTTYTYYVPQAAAPDTAKGKVYFNDAANTLYVYNGTSWQDLLGAGAESDPIFSAWTGYTDSRFNYLNATTTNIDNLNIFTGATTTSLFASNDLTVAGNASTTGYLTIGSKLGSWLPSAGDLFVGGNATVTSNLSIGGVAYVWPGADGSNGQALTTNGTGGLAWSAVSATPAGTNGQIQYNNAGAFGASVDLYWDSVSTILGVATSTQTGNIISKYINSGYTNGIFSSEAATTTYISAGNSGGYNGADVYLSQGGVGTSFMGDNPGGAGGNVYLAAGGSASGSGAAAGNAGNVTMAAAGSVGSSGTDGTVTIGSVAWNNATLNVYGSASTTNLRVTSGYINKGDGFLTAPIDTYIGTGGTALGSGQNAAATYLSIGGDSTGFMGAIAGANGGNVYFANGGNGSDGTVAAGNAGNVTLAAAGSVGNAGQDGTVILGSSQWKNATLNVYGTTLLAGAASTTGTLVVNGAANDSSYISPTSTLTVLGSGSFTGNVSVGGNATTSGSLVVGTTNPTINLNAGDLFVGGNATVTSNLSIGGVAYVWPNADGSSGQVLKTNGLGVLTWSADDTTAGSGMNDWQVIFPNALAPTSTNDLTGLFVTASSTFSNLRIDGSLNATTTNIDNLNIFTGATTTSLYASNDLTVAGNASTTGYLTIGSNLGSWLPSAGDLFVGGNATATGNLNVGSGSGDSVLDLMISGVRSWIFGADDSDSDNFVVATSSLGTDNILVLSQVNGAVYLPKVYEHTSASASNVFIDTDGQLYRSTAAGGSGTNDWQVIFPNALAPTSTNDLTGLFVTASSTFSNLRIDGSLNATTTNIDNLTIYTGATTTSLYASNDLVAMGNVGIGTLTPTNKLDVVGAAGSAATIQLTTGGTSGWRAVIGLNNAAADGGRNYQFYSTNGGDGIFGAGKFVINDTTTGENTGYRLVIDSSGNVGIGTTAPLALFNVSGTTLLGGAASTTGTLVVNGAANDSSYISPTSTLTVLGSGSFTGNIVVGGNATTTGDSIVVGGAVIGSAGGVGVDSKLNVVGGAITIGSASFDADASLHIGGAYGGNNRLTQMAPSNTGVEADAYNLMYSRGVGGAAQYFSWGISSAGSWTIAPGADSISTATTDKFTINSSGLVGIGTTLPRAMLDVTSGTANVAGDTSNIANFTGANQTANSSNVSINTNNAFGIDLGGSIALGGLYRSGGVDNAAFGIIKAGKTNSIDTDYSGYLSFGTRNNNSSIAERLRIDNLGNVGIGTTAPTAPLTVSIATTTAGMVRAMIVSHGTPGTDLNGAYIEFPASVTDGYGAQIGGLREGTGGLGSLVIRTGGNTQTERMRITDSGNVGIGTTAPLALFNVSGTTLLGGAASTTGTLVVNAAANDSSYISPTSTLTVLGSGSFTGNIVVGGNATTSGNLVVGTTNPTINLNAGDLFVGGNATVTSNLSIGGVAYVWPNADGSNGQALTTNGTGGLAWSTITGGTGMNDWQVLFPGALAPTSTNDLTGLFVTASSTFSNLRIDGSLNATTTNIDNLFVYGNATTTGDSIIGGGAVIGSAEGVGGNSKLNVVGGAITIASIPFTANASLHIAAVYGGNNRLTQMGPANTGVAAEALNLMYSRDSAGNPQYFTWGMSSSGKWMISPGALTSLDNGLTVTSASSVGIGLTNPTSTLSIFVPSTQTGYGIDIVNNTAAQNSIYDSSGAKLTKAGTWTNAPSWSWLKNIVTEPAGYLDKVAALPIHEWQYKNKAMQDETTHLSPFLDDYNLAFGLGHTNEVNLQDWVGVAMQAIKELNVKVEAQQETYDRLTVNEPATSTPIVVIDNPESDIKTLVVREAATFYGTIYVRGEAGFEDKVVFNKDIEVKGKIYASADQAGTATILAGATSTEVVFGSEYEVVPKITASLQKAKPVFYGIEGKTAAGFRIVLTEPFTEDLSFDWIALAVKGGQAPVITDLIVPAGNIMTGDAVEFWAKVTDADTPDSDLKYTWNFSPNLGTLTGDTGLVYWTVNSALNGNTEVTVTVTVSDGAHLTTRSQVVNVIGGSNEPTPPQNQPENPAEEPPVASTPPVQAGCMDSSATNYNPAANQDDGSCLFAENPTPDTQAETPPPTDTAVSASEPSNGETLP